MCHQQLTTGKHWLDGGVALPCPCKLCLSVNNFSLCDRTAQRGQAPDARFQDSDLRIEFSRILNKAAALRRATGGRYTGK
jgi:hypothetical protein